MERNEKARGMRSELEIAAHAMGLSELIVAASPRLVMSALAFIAAMYAVLLVCKAVVS